MEEVVSHRAQYQGREKHQRAHGAAMRIEEMAQTRDLMDTDINPTG